MFLEKFEINVNKIKEKLGSKRLHVISFCIFGITMLFALQMANVYGRSRQSGSDVSNRTLYNMIGNVKNAEVFLEKVRVTTTKSQQISSLVEILSQTNLAKEALANLPVNQNSMNNVSKFFTQVADFSKYAIKKLATEDLSEKDYEILKKINESMISVTDTLDSIYDEMSKGSISWDEVSKVADGKLENNKNILVQGIEDIKNNFVEYEGLIYDGAYSSHLESTTPKLIEGLRDVTITEAKDKAISCVKSKFSSNNLEEPKIYDVQYMGQTNGKIDLYTFKIILEKSSNDITVQITKSGGLLYLMVQDRVVKTKKISDEEAKKIGEKYLNNIGITNMIATYLIEQENMVTINYASNIGGVVIYTDLVKVKIAQDTGEVCSVECGGYIFNHHERENLIPNTTKESAMAVLNKEIDVQSTGLAIIPNDINEEILTYEFKGKVEEREYIIYINATTLEEEQVLIILNTPGGKLTM